MRPMPSPAPAAMPAHFDGLLRRLLFAFAVIALTRGFTDAIATRASFTFATLRDLTFRGTAASLSFQVRSSEVVWISMIFPPWTALICIASEVPRDLQADSARDEQTSSPETPKPCRTHRRTPSTDRSQRATSPPSR